MGYEVTLIPMPETSVEIQNEINNATSDGSKLECVFADNGQHGNRLIIVTSPP